MFIWMLLEKATKLTTGTDVDDKLVADLQKFFESSPALRASILSVIWRGFKNGFDFDDEEWTGDILAVVFDIIRTNANDSHSLQ